MTMWPLPDDGSFARRHRLPSTDDADVQLADAVAKRLGDSPGLRHQRITVEVQNRVVLLSGTVDSPHTKQIAGDTARHVDGTLDVCNDIRVDRPADQPAGATTTRTGSQDAFDQITHDLIAEVHSANRRPRRLTKAAVAVLAVLLWAALSVLMVRYGWIGVAVTCAVAAIVIHIAHGRRRGRRRGTTKEPPPPRD